MNSDGAQYGTSGSTFDHIDREEVLENIEDKLAGSNRCGGTAS